LRERLHAQRKRAATQVRDAQAECFVQAGVDSARQRREICFGFRDRGFGGGAASFTAQRGLGDGFEIALQWPSIGGWDQALAGAPAGDEHGGEDAQQAGEQESDQAIHGH
jgi:hypothetical protein